MTAFLQNVPESTIPTSLALFPPSGGPSISPLPLRLGILFLLLTVGVGGYLLPTPSSEAPVRLLLPNSAGTVIFSHASHQDISGIECSTCHHTTTTEADPPPCSACHPAGFGDTFVSVHQAYPFPDDQCRVCHHAAWQTGYIFDHQEHENITDCASCHHQGSGEPPIACSSCHGRDDSLPGKNEALHASCAACHDQVNDASLRGCTLCHSLLPVGQVDLAAPPPCQTCHSGGLDGLVPVRKLAFHGNCIGCHMKLNAGPFHVGSETKDCEKCHFPG